MSQILIHQVQKRIEKIQQEFQSRYKPLIFHMDCRATSSGELCIHGKVLTQKQLARVLSYFAKLPITPVIEVLSQKESHEFGNAPLGTPVLDSPYSGHLVSQILSWEGPFSLLDYPPVEGYQLIRMKDGTLGWIEKAKIKLQKSNPSLWEYLGPKVLRPISPYQKEMAIQTGKEWLGTPYLLGGRTKSGIDCSALVQALFRDCLAILLPRHSRDQRKLGIRVRRREVQPLDLIFGKSKKEGYSHVGLVWEGNGILHSSKKQKKVVKEGWEEFENDYQILGIRRVVDYDSF